MYLLLGRIDRYTPSYSLNRYLAKRYCEQTERSFFIEEKHLDENILRPEFSEAMKRIEAEEHRQNKRLDKLDEQMDTLTELVASVREIAISIKTMQADLTKQGERLEKIEQEPADNWKKAVWLIVAAVIGFAIHAVLGI